MIGQVTDSRNPGVCKFTASRFGRKTLKLGSAAAVAFAGLVAAASVASAAPIPPSGGDCPNGYVAVQANKSYYGGAAGVRGPNQGTGATPTQDEIIGLACFKRSSPTRGTLQFRWSAVGPLYEGILYYQLYDCTAHTVARQHSKALEYPTGTKSTYGQARAELALNPKHKYAARVTGQGAYKRPSPVLAGATGYFTRYGAPKPFFDQSGCQ